MTHQLAQTGPSWAKLVAPVAEDIAKLLAGSSGSRIDRLPTPLTNANRHRGRQAMRRRSRSQPQAKPDASCRRCGVETPHRDRHYCDECLPLVQAEQYVRYERSGLIALERMKAQGQDPTHGESAGRKRGEAISKRKREAANWDREHGRQPDTEYFCREILPVIQGVPLRQLLSATGLSIRYCSMIRRGERVPHPSHWQAFAMAGGAEVKRPSTQRAQP